MFIYLSHVQTLRDGTQDTATTNPVLQETMSYVIDGPVRYRRDCFIEFDAAYKYSDLAKYMYLPTHRGVDRVGTIT